MFKKDCQQSNVNTALASETINSMQVYGSSFSYTAATPAGRAGSGERADREWPCTQVKGKKEDSLRGTVSGEDPGTR